MNIFCRIPQILPLTLCIVAAVTTLMLLEKLLTPKVVHWGDFYASFLTFLVIISKTVIPLVVIWKVFDLKLALQGWIGGGLFQAFWKGLVLSAFMMAFTFIYQKYSHHIFGQPYASTGGRFMEQKITKAAIRVGIAAALLNAFGEEIIFRGMLLPALSNHLGIALAIFTQSFIFTIYHIYPLQNSVLLFTMGIFFGLGYLWSNSLLTPVLAHLIENGLPTLLLLTRSSRVP